MGLKETIKNSVSDYFESTTIHGFSYLRVSHNLFERLAWILIIGTCFTLAGMLIQQSIHEANENPIITTFDTVHVRNVPFPAITVDSGKLDEFAYGETILNGLAFDRIKDFENHEADELHERFSTMIDGIINALYLFFTEWYNDRVSYDDDFNTDDMHMHLLNSKKVLKYICAMVPDEKGSKLLEIAKMKLFDGRYNDPLNGPLLGHFAYPYPYITFL